MDMQNGNVVITLYRGENPVDVIPSIINGLPVIGIGDWAFQDVLSLEEVVIPGSVQWIGAWTFADCENLETVTVGDGVIWIGEFAFAFCSSLQAVYFDGDAPPHGLYVFSSLEDVSIHYNPRTSGWGDTWAGMPTIPIVLPHIVSGDAEFGMRHDGFTLPIGGGAGQSVVVEVLDDLRSGAWIPVQTNLLDGSGTWIFRDSEATDHSQRFYRVREE